MDTCFLCEIGSKNRVPSGRSGVAEGFGTCGVCNVHACATHGDRSPAVFRCADCAASPARPGQVPSPNGTTVGQGPPPAGGVDAPEADRTSAIVARMAERGAVGLVGLAPGLAPSALGLMTPDTGDRMLRVLERSVEEVRYEGPGPQAPAGMVPDVLRAADEVRHHDDDPLMSLGYAWRERRPAGIDLGSQMTDLLETRAEALGLEAWAELARTPGVLDGHARYTVEQAEFVAALVALSVVARGGHSLEDNPLALPGGLLMPGLTLLLLLRFQAS